MVTAEIVTGLTLIDLKCVGNAGMCLYLNLGGPGVVRIEELVVVNNTAMGGVVGNIDGAGIIIVKNAVLKGNYAISGCAGLVITPPTLISSSFSLSNSLISDNSNSKASFLTIYNPGKRMLSTSLFTIEITNTEFVNNTGDMYGTCIGVYDFLPIKYGIIENCTFVGNFNRKFGAAMMVSVAKGDFVVRGCEFRENFAAYGSVLYAKVQSREKFPAVLYLSDCEIEGNHGGSVVEMDGTHFISQIISSDLRFTHNSGPCFVIIAGKLTDSGSFYIENTAKRGSILHITSFSSVLFMNSVLSNNIADYGGAVYISSNSEVTISACTAVNNTANIVGGVIFIDQFSTLSIDLSIFADNFAFVKGSGVYAVYSKVRLRNTSFMGNRVEGYGTVYCADSELVLVNMTMGGNTAAGSSSGIAGTSVYVEAEECHFLPQSAISGAMFLLDQSHLRVNNSEFYGCVALSSGGCIFAAASSVTISNSHITQAVALVGAAFRMDQGSNLTLTSVSISHTNTYTKVGAVAVTGGVTTISSSTFAHITGQALYVMYGVLYMNTSSFEYATGISGSGVYLLSSAAAIDRCSFKGNTAMQGAAIYNGADSPKTVTITNSLFEENISQSGGAYFSESAHCLMENNVFRGNKAVIVPGITGSGAGGAIMLSCLLFQSCPSVIQNNDFIGNVAEIKGGAITWQHSPSEFINNTFLNNSAVYGPNIASYAVKLKPLTADKQIKAYLNDTMHPPLAFSIENLGSGHLYDGLIHFGMFDHKNQLVNIDSSSGVEVSVPSNSNITVFGNINTVAAHGIVTFSAFTLTAKPGSSQYVEVATPAIRKQQLASSDQDIIEDVMLVKFTFRECLMGEYQQGDSCEECIVGTYSFNSSVACENCPEGAICYGNYTMVPKSGYWRADVYSPVFFKCSNQDACIGSPGNNLSFHGLCASGYQGNVCASCEPDYSITGKDTCSKCPSLAANILISIFVAAVALTFLAAAIIIAIRSATRPNSELAIYVKIMMNYVQMMIISASLNMNWPNYTATFLNMQIMVGNAAEQIFSVDCMLQMIETDRLLFVKITLVSILPLVLLVIAVAAWLIIEICKSITLLKEKLVATFVMVLFLLHTTITKSAFAVFPCKELKAGEQWLEKDLDQRCWDFSHTRFVETVALPSIVVWVMGLPLVCLLYIHRRRIALHNPKVQMQYSFLYKGYQRERYFWEFVILYRKIALVMSLVFLASVSAAVQAQTVLLILLISIIFQIYIQPFNIPIMNILETKSILASIVTVYCGLYYENQSVGEI